MDRIRAAMLGGAIGDAMGGPVEGRHHREIREAHGRLDRFLPYGRQPSYHGPFDRTAGVYTDDTRLKHVLCRAILAVEDLPGRGDFARVLVETYHRASDDLERGFLEEYATAALYGEEKLPFGGQPTNGAIMMNSPIGLVCACDPHTAFSAAFTLSFITDGYARYSAALMAAAVAAAMTPGVSPDGIVSSALEAAAEHRREGALTKTWGWYEHVFTLNERLLHTALDLAAQKWDPFALYESYYENLRVSSLGSEAAQTLAVSLGLFYAAKGAFDTTVVACVNYGRDNDSYASVAGALAGAYRGMKAIPQEWADEVRTANPAPDMDRLAEGLARVARKRYTRTREVLDRFADLLMRDEPGN